MTNGIKTRVEYMAERLKLCKRCRVEDIHTRYGKREKPYLKCRHCGNLIPQFEGRTHKFVRLTDEHKKFIESNSFVTATTIKKYLEQHGLPEVSINSIRNYKKKNKGKSDE